MSVSGAYDDGFKDDDHRDLEPGTVYRHKKNGKIYIFLFLARMHTTGEPHVAYVPAYTDPDFNGPRISLRPREEFLDRFEPVG